MKNLFSLSFVSLFLIIAATPAFADRDDSRARSNPEDEIHVLIEPIIGYQSLKRSYPYDHNEGMLTYGARVVVGTYRLAGEAEFQFGSATETFTNPAVSDETDFSQARLGARTIYPLIEEIHLVFRGGLEGYRYSSQIKDGVTTVSDSPNWKVEPYVGAGVIFYFFKSLSLSVEEVYVVDTGTETSFGFRLFI